MKDVSQETLQAIQSNVKVEETQSLKRSVDNLLQASWKDFEIADLQPNLIPDGWDSFEPYGSGKNYVENWDFNSNDLSQFRGYSTKFSIKNNMLYIYETGELGDANAGFAGVLPKGAYKVRYKVKAPFGVREYQWLNTSVEKENVARPKSDEFIVYEREFEVIDESKPIRVTFFPTNENTVIPHKGNYLYIDWIQITPVDNQHLVVEKTPLDNGLTRIQTWGGNNAIKLLYNFPVNIEGNHNLSMLVELNNRFTITLNNKNLKNIFVDESRYINETHNFSKETFANVQIRVRGNDSLDFIASTPTIVEGDKHNPVLIIDQLDDGTEHVQVYGAYPDTKLVYKGGKGFIGENYKLTSNIKNEGVELGINTSIGSSTIPKGDSKLEIEGELQEQDFTIELGARDV